MPMSLNSLQRFAFIFCCFLVFWNCFLIDQQSSATPVTSKKLRKSLKSSSVKKSAKVFVNHETAVNSTSTASVTSVAQDLGKQESMVMNSQEHTSEHDHHEKAQDNKCSNYPNHISLTKRAIGIPSGSSRLWPMNTIPIYVINHHDNLNFSSLLSLIQESSSSNKSPQQKVQESHVENTNRKQYSIHDLGLENDFNVESLGHQRMSILDHLRAITQLYSKNVPGLNFEYIVNLRSLKSIVRQQKKPVLIVGKLPQDVKDCSNDWIISTFGHYSKYPNIMLISPDLLDQKSKMIRRSLMRQMAHVLGMEPEHWRYETTELFTNYMIPRLPFFRKGSYDFLSITHEVPENMLRSSRNAFGYPVSSTPIADTSYIPPTSNYDENPESSTSLLDENNHNKMVASSENHLNKRGWWSSVYRKPYRPGAHYHQAAQQISHMEEEDVDEQFLLIQVPRVYVTEGDDHLEDENGTDVFRSGNDNGEGDDDEEEDRRSDELANRLIESSYSSRTNSRSPSRSPPTDSSVHRDHQTIDKGKAKIENLQEKEPETIIENMVHKLKTTNTNSRNISIPKFSRGEPYLLPGQVVSDSVPQVVDSAYFYLYAMVYGKGGTPDSKKAWVARSIGKTDTLSPFDIVYLNEIYPASSN